MSEITPRVDRIDYVSLSILFIAIVTIALVLVGHVTMGTHLAAVVPPTLLGVWCILTLRK